MKWLSEILKIVLDAIFPPICLNCLRPLAESEKNMLFCFKCFGRFSYTPSLLCPVCKRRLPDAEVHCHEDAKFILASPFKFEDSIVQKTIYLLKYKKVKAAGKPLAFFMSKCLIETVKNSRLNNLPVTVVPVPLYKSKERRRGFNQSSIISEWLVFYLKKSNLFPEISVEKSMVIKYKKTPSQTEQKSYILREKNVEDSFRITDERKVTGKNFLIIDDVFTSGATTREIAGLLKKHGARNVMALTAART